jgi:hypothetical protein
MTPSAFYDFLQGFTSDIEVRPGLTLSTEDERFVLHDAHRRMLLAPQEMSFLGLANLISRWPVPSGMG